MRNAAPDRRVGTPASLTVTPAFLNEKMERPDGDAVPMSGVTRMPPDAVVEPELVATIRCMDRAAMEYGEDEPPEPRN